MGASLAQKGIELDERDFFQDRFSEEELRRLIGTHTVSEYFSWKSPSFKKLSLDREGLDDDHLIRLMLEEPRLIRRPLIRVGDQLIVGTDKESMEGAFPTSD